jgi:hypothetical protein
MAKGKREMIDLNMVSDEEIQAYFAKQAASVHVGQKVRCNGYDGVIKEVCQGKLLGMVVVRVPGGETCVGVSELNRD